MPAYGFFWADVLPGETDWVTWTGPKRNLGDQGATNIHTVANIVPDGSDHVFRSTWPNRAQSPEHNLAAELR